MKTIEIINLSKEYRINNFEPYLSIRDKFVDFFSSKKNKRNDFYALKNVSFSVKKGETMGIIGHNGAGKSTLLKILSMITPPSFGEVKMRGTISSILEVGTGFHPELSGKENIFLNSAILGMKKKEIKKKFNDILNFSGIEKFINTPVKHYSSGMYVRLAFSIAAFMDTDILLIDEVLAVGDFEFQKKCRNKINEISEKKTRTIIFVSHDLGAVRNICDRTVLLARGEIKKIGETKDVINSYINYQEEESEISLDKRKDRSGNGKVKITKLFFVNCDNQKITNIISGEKVYIKIEYESGANKENEVLDIFLGINSETGERIFTLSNKYTGNYIKNIAQKAVLICEIPFLPLAKGFYYIAVTIKVNGDTADNFFNICKFSVENGSIYKAGMNDLSLPGRGNIVLRHEWKQKF